jgi:CheY-like chemotaxis protein
MRSVDLFQQDEPIDILFTDINLPDGRDTIDGLELARKATDAAGRWAICVPLTRGDKIVVPPHIPQSVIISAESIFGFLDCVIEEPLARPIESKLKGEAVARRQM